MKSLKCKIQSAGIPELRWRRIQVHEQQSERQRKNILQKVLCFSARAKELQVEDRGSKISKIISVNQFPGSPFISLSSQRYRNPEDTVKFPESKYKDAFFAAMEEYNQYGIAEVNSRYRLDKSAMDELYGFKVAWC